MTLSPTPLLLALLPLLATAAPADTHTTTDASTKITKLATVQVIADAKDLVDRMKHKMAMRERFLAKKAGKLAALRQKKTDKD